MALNYNIIMSDDYAHIMWPLITSVTSDVYVKF